MTADREDASPAWSCRLISELDAADRRALALAKDLTPRQLGWAPGPGEWGVGQCLDHLRIANDVAEWVRHAPGFPAG